MPSISDLDYTDNMASNRKPFLTDIRETLDSFETYINDSIKDNLVQLALDSYGSPYAFDSDGAAQYTNNLYDKLYASNTYTGGDITMGSSGAWTDVDANNAKVSITPELAGDFRAVFQFSILLDASNDTNHADLRFRLTDGSTNSNSVPRILVHNLAINTGAKDAVLSLSIEHTFASLAASAQTIKLQYYDNSSNAMTAMYVLANSTTPFVAYVEKV